MKTKHILTALALPTVFAACTADDIVSENNALQQAERAKLSKDFVLNINNGVESRYAVEGTTDLDFIFEANDSIGANLIDEPTFDANSNPVEDPAKWNIVSYIAPAHPFVNAGGEQWLSDGELGVGNYLFTNPYNAADKNRLAAKFQLPVVVEYDSENPNAVIEKYNKAVSVATLYEGDKAANINLKNLYTYPKVRLHFNKMWGVTNVTKVVLGKGTATNPGFIFKGGLDHKYINHMFAQETIDAWLEAETKKGNKVTEADYWNAQGTSQFIIDNKDGKLQTSDAAITKYGKPEYTQYFIYEMNEKTISYGDTDAIEVRLMLPSEDNFTNTGITLYVCTNLGTYEVPFNSGNMAFNEQTVEAQKKVALLRNKSYTLNVNYENWKKSSIVEFGNVVSTAEDWNKLVAKYGDLKKYSAEYKAGKTPTTNTDAQDLIVNIISENFAFTSELEMPEVAEFVIKSNANVEGEVSLKNIKMDNAILKVKKGATLIAEQTLVAPTVNVEKGGTLKFAKAYDEDEILIANKSVTTLNNEGKVLVPAGVIAEFVLNNAKDAEVVVGEKAASRAAAEVAEANFYGVNNGLITNYSVINVIDKKVTVTDEEGNVSEKLLSLDNNASSTDNGYKYDSKLKVWDGVPTIVNEGTFNAKGLTNNYGLFKNEKALNSGFSGNAYFYNFGILEVAENASTYIDSNKDGEIVLANYKPENFVIHGAKNVEDYSNDACGTITYTLNDKSKNVVDLSKSPVNKFITNVGIELTNTYTYKDEEGETQVKALDHLVVNGGSVKVASRTGEGTTDSPYVYAAHVAKMTIKGDVAVSGTINAVDNVEIAADATLSVPSNANLTVDKMNNISSIEAVAANKEKKNGELIIVGLLHLTKETGNTDGVYIGTVPTFVSVPNKGDYITCGKIDTTAADAETLTNAKKAALKPLIKLCIDKTAVMNEELTWIDFTAAKIATSDWNTVDNVFGVTTVADFVTTWNGISGQNYIIDTKKALDSQIDNILNNHKDLILKATTGTDGKVTYSGVVMTIKGEVNLGTSISKVLNGNAWVEDNVFVKSLANQKLSTIAYNGVNMYEAFVGALEVNEGDLDNAAWMTFKEMQVAKTSEGENAYPANIYSYLPAYSYVETYETAAVYTAVKLWISLSQEYGAELNSGYEFDTTGVVAADMAKFFNAAYKAKTSDKFKDDTLYKNAVSTITETYITTVASWAYNNAQIAKLAEKFASEFELGTTIRPADQN